MTKTYCDSCGNELTFSRGGPIYLPGHSEMLVTWPVVRISGTGKDMDLCEKCLAARLMSAAKKLSSAKYKELCETEYLGE